MGAAASSHTHTYSSITGKPTTFAPIIGNTSTTAMAGNTSIPSAYSLPLSASGTRGGVKIGYSENGKNYPVELSAEKMYVNVPWTDNNTVYTHPTFNGDDFSVDTGALTGAVVVSDIDINVTTDTNGHVTDANGSVSTRTLTLANLGYTGATNANNITNTNQLTNGSGYLTSTNDRVYLTDSRGSARAPSYYNDRYAQWDFQSSTDTGAGGDGWHAIQTISKWTVYDASHRQEQLIFTGNDLKRRTASSDTAWGTTKLYMIVEI